MPVVDYLSPDEARSKGVTWRSRQDIEAANRASANPAPAATAPRPPAPTEGPYPSLGITPPSPVSTARTRTASAAGQAGRTPIDTGREGIDAVPGVDDMINRDVGSWEATLRQAAQAYGLQFHQSDLDGVIRNVSYAQNAGRDPADFIRNQLDIYARRAAPTGHRTSDSQGGAYPDIGGDPRTEAGYRAPANQPDLAALFPQLFGGQRIDDEQRGSPAPPPVRPAAFNQAAYQAYQQANPQNPISPFEFVLGRSLTSDDAALWARGENAPDITPEIVAFYESGGATWPGPRPSVTLQPPPGGTTAPGPTTNPGPPNLNPRGPAAGTNPPGGRPNVNVPAQFDDPISSFIEQFAQRRAQERENPSEGSGQALLEAALRDIAAQFGSGGFTNAEQEIYQTQAIDPIEQLRQARKQQIIHELSQRGIAPSSGVAIQMLQDVDRQFDAMRTQTQSGLAGQFGQERVNRMLQSLALYGNLAGTENDRLNEAFQYRTVPLNLADRSFNQAFQLYSANNPLSLINPLMQLGSLQQGRTDNSQRALADLVWALTQGGG